MMQRFEKNDAQVRLCPMLLAKVLNMRGSIQQSLQWWIQDTLYDQEAHAKMGLRTYQRGAADMPLPSVHSDKES
ncbi:hypothetical protein DPMN_058814 [Dreissena polymorpha]|uniref:Uncharacterized protein n=1 Tax=Dreissena polymorpha TaxID=45954 RepID=A0A9D4C2F4_DREPO|nr:hypothetical protein DPMN_058814 [Dreissena polymorpha]